MNTNKYLFKIISFLTAILLVMIFIGDKTEPIVAKTHTSQTQIKLSFNRLVDTKKIEKDFQITPKVEGKFSWIGRQMAFTPLASLAPGTSYKITIAKITDQNQKSSTKPFEYSFKTPDQLLYYLKDRSIYSYNLTTDQHQKLTNPNLKVLEFKLAPPSNEIYFFATTENVISRNAYLTDYQELFKLNLENLKVKKLAAAGKFVNFDFDVSPDGFTYALMRAEIKYKTLHNRGITIFSKDAPPKKLWFDKIVDAPIFISPFSDSLLGNAYDTGFSVVPLSLNPNRVQQLGTFFDTFGFTPDAQKIVFTELLQDQSEQIVIINSEGKKEVLNTSHSPDYLDLQNEGVYFSTNDDYSFALYFYNFETQTIQEILSPTSSNSFEVFDVSPTKNFLAVETFAINEDAGLGSKARTFKENLENTFQNAKIQIVSLEDSSIHGSFSGRYPQFAN